MNDTKARENAYLASCAAVERQQQVVDEAAARTENWRKSYLSAVAAAATESEKLRRKKDQMVGLAWIGIILAAAFITLIFFGGGWAIGVIVCSIGIAVLVRSNKADARNAEYNGRKEFFTKYYASLPQGTYLKWKEVQAPAQNQSVANQVWTCPHCNTKNTLSSEYCTSCGKKMP